LASAPPPRPYGASPADPRGLRITAVPASFTPAVHPPMSFSPPSESYETSPPRVVSDYGVPPVRFPASSRHQRRGSARHGGFHTTAAFRPRVFATPRRLAPHVTLRAYSIPQARPGFSLQGLSLARSRLGSSPRPCPLAVTAGTPLLAKRLLPKPHFRALLPWRVRCARPAVKRTVHPIPSWAFPSSGLASSRP
jgi:hypothetical protein